MVSKENVLKRIQKLIISNLFGDSYYSKRSLKTFFERFDKIKEVKELSGEKEEIANVVNKSGIIDLLTIMSISQHSQMKNFFIHPTTGVTAVLTGQILKPKIELKDFDYSETGLAIVNTTEEELLRYCLETYSDKILMDTLALFDVKELIEIEKDEKLGSEFISKVIRAYYEKREKLSEKSIEVAEELLNYILKKKTMNYFRDVFYYGYSHGYAGEHFCRYVAEKNLDCFDEFLNKARSHSIDMKMLSYATDPVRKMQFVRDAKRALKSKGYEERIKIYNIIIYGGKLDENFAELLGREKSGKVMNSALQTLIGNRHNYSADLFEDTLALMAMTKHEMVLNRMAEIAPIEVIAPILSGKSFPNKWRLQRRLNEYNEANAK